MSKTRCRELLEIGDRLFSDRMGLMSLWQDIADNFYPERGDFTTVRCLGEEFGTHLMSSYPVLARRTLGDQFGAMLRPRQKTWAKLGVQDDRINEDTSAKSWLESRSEIMRKAMYEREAQFVRATNEGDHDFASFGNAVIEARMRDDLSGLLYRCYHLRDVVWCENAEGMIDHIDRRFKLPAKTICKMFPKTAPKAVKDCLAKEPDKEFDVRHIVMSSEDYEMGDAKKYNRNRFKFVSVYLLKEDETILEELPRKRLGFIIPRWKTLPGSQYGLSPATMTALPDARLMQQMSTALLEAGEKAVTPPMIATQEAVRSDIDLAAGGVTWVDMNYDEKMGEVLRPITQALEGIRYGLEMIQDVRDMVQESFYLNKINLPEIGPDMTAFEVQERVKEHIRAVLPLFEPMESEYNGQLCDETFELLLENGALGSPDDMPDVLAGQEVRFNFESPLQATADRAKLEAFKEAAQLTAMAAQIDPSVVAELNTAKAFREALSGAQVPADWLHDPEYVEQLKAYQAKQAQAAQAAAAAQQGAGIVEQLGKGVGALGKIAPQAA